MKTARLPAIYLEENLFAERIGIEAMIRPGLPVFRITGTNGRSRDREERIRTALLASGIQFPYCTVLVNLSPADRVKDSALLDLPIALCLLKAMNLPGIRQRFGQNDLFLGELSLTGKVCDLPELPGWALSGVENGFERVFLPLAAAGRLPVGSWTGVQHLSDLIEGNFKILSGNRDPVLPNPPIALELPAEMSRILMLAAAGKHGVLLIGPPGSGKSISARYLYDLLPLPDPTEQRRIIRNRLLFREADPENPGRPLRQPHHSITVTGMVGGGTPLRAGEANRASDGLLILDELAEYDRHVVEALREPLESQEISHNRNGRPGALPARFWLAATANPCPCGFFRSARKACRCSRLTVDRRRQLLSGPFTDRIDLHYFCEPGRPRELVSGNNISEIQSGIAAAVRVQRLRNGDLWNGELKGAYIEMFCKLRDESAEAVWNEILEDTLSRRRAAGIRRLARTIADLDETPSIRAEDLLEARSYHLPEDFWEAAAPRIRNHS